MNVRGRLASLSTAAALSLACDPIMAVRARVTTVPEPESAGSNRIDTLGSPIVGATVTLACPYGERELGTTDPAGRLDYATVGLLSRDCSVRVDASGYHSDHFAVGDLCVVDVGSDCHYLALLAELAPERAPAARVPKVPRAAAAARTTRVQFTSRATRGLSVFKRRYPTPGFLCRARCSPTTRSGPFPSRRCSSPASTASPPPWAIASRSKRTGRSP